MTEPFVGEIQAFAFGFAPVNWALCNGQIMSIQQNAALFSLLGTYYGGNGTSTFALPNLQSRVPIGFGQSSYANYVNGQIGGEEAVMLTVSELPMHAHSFVGANANGVSAQADPGFLLATSYVASGTPLNFYAPDTTPQALNAGSLLPYGSGQAHPNIQPYRAINWCISLGGIFPSRG